MTPTAPLAIVLSVWLGAAAEPPAPPDGDGRVRLTLADAVRLAMRSDAVRIHRLAHETARQDLVGARGRAYDPIIKSTLSANNGTEATTSLTEGAPILSKRRREASAQVEQQLPSGTRAILGVTGHRLATNANNASVNPSYESSIQVGVRQPLLRNRTGLAVRGPVLLAEHNEAASRATLEAELAGAVEDTVRQYWAAVLARERLEVQRRSLGLAEATNSKNRRMLEMGTIAPLEIHRSESDVASRKLDLVAAEFGARREVDALRRQLGLDADPATANVDLVLLDRPGVDEAAPPDLETALADARRARPERLAQAALLRADETSVRLAREETRLGLDLAASYTASGVAGRALDLRDTPATVLSNTRLRDAFHQVFHRDFPTWSVSLTLDVPTRNRAARAALATARAEQQRSRLQLDELDRGIALEVRTALDQLEQTRQSITLAAAVRDHAQKTFEAERRKHELGTIELFFVLESQTRLAQAEMGLLAARANYENARTRLDLVTGRLLPRYAISIDEGTGSLATP